MKIAVACDHGAYQHKEALKKHLEGLHYEVIDFGTNSLDSMDYPDTVYPAAKAVANHEADYGIVLCSTGIGACITANKVNGIRCALVHNRDIAKITREHNDSNVLAMGAKVVSEEEMIEIAVTWLETPFSFDLRHMRRITKITEVEKEEDYEG
jgi:sugar-phosphate isomerases, RpiB/LacA/LacB family